MDVLAHNSFFESLKKIGSFSEKIATIRSWFHYHFTKDFFNILKTALKGYPWDYCFLLELEQAKLREMANYIEKTNRYKEWEKDVRDMRLCISLIDIMLEKKEMFHFNGNLIYEKQDEKIDGEDTYEIKHSDDFEYVCDVKVNTRNIDRFVKDEGRKNGYLHMPHELYMLKAKHLYHQIRMNRENCWWD